MDQRTFTLADQLAFATLSGDFNPMHVDPLAARRIMFGVPVVHGAHLVLWALEQALSKEVARISRLRVSFDHAVRIGDQVELREKSVTDEFREVVVISNGRSCCRIKVELGGSESAPLEPGLKIQGQRLPREWTAAQIGEASGMVPVEIDAASAETLAPETYRMSPEILSLLAVLSRLVGTECPGTHSIFSGFDARRHDEMGSASELRWKVSEFDERFSKASIDAHCGSFDIQVTAFLRPPPQRQPPSTELKASVPAAAFEGRRAVVIGGSRGLGELCAKLLALGGAEVCITFNNGAADAEAVENDIRSAGGDAHTSQYDILGETPAGISEMVAEWHPTHLYYFASPPIFVATRTFSTELFSRFCRYYVDGFVNAVRAFRAGPLHAFYPSSVAVQEFVPDMGEYAAAKAAGENVCRHLEKVERNLTTHVVRLPRLPTDQTSTVFPTETADPVPILMDILKSA